MGKKRKNENYSENEVKKQILHNRGENVSKMCTIGVKIGVNVQGGTLFSGQEVGWHLEETWLILYMSINIQYTDFELL
jgi:hypothetical protein